MAPPPVAIAVVSFNTRDLLAACLSALEPEAAAGRAEVWVVDNASTDGSAELVREQFPDVRLLALVDNAGFGGAVNAVAARTQSEWIAPANADIELLPGTLETLLAAGSRHPRAGVLAPRLVNLDGSPQHSVYAFPTLPFTAVFNLGLQRVVRGLGDRMCLEGYWNPQRSRRVDWAIAAFVLVRRRAWDAVGGFDSGQWMYAEDLDLGWRLARAGWETRFVAEAPIRHHGAAATEAVWGDGRRERWLAATYACLLRRRGVVRTRATAAINVAGALARYALFAAATRLRTSRFTQRRDDNARWARGHRVGFASRRALESLR